MDLIKNLLQEFYENDDLHKEQTLIQHQMDKLEHEFQKSLNEEQIKTFDKILDLFSEIHGINEELLAKYLFKTIKQIYRQLLFC